MMSNFDDDGNFDYTCGVEVSDFSRVPADWSRVRIPAQEYAVFTHRDHISTIRSTWATIWNKWLPESGREVTDAPNFELYGEDFDSVTGRGLVENEETLGDNSHLKNFAPTAVGRSPDTIFGYGPLPARVGTYDKASAHNGSSCACAKSIRPSVHEENRNSHAFLRVTRGLAF